MTNVVNNDGVGLSKFVTPPNTGDVTANEQITDSVDFPHTGLLKALYTTATGNHALRDGAAGSMGFNFTYSGGSSPQLAVAAGKIFRDGKYVSVSALSATALTKASGSGTKVYHIVVVNSSNALAIRQSGATTTNKIPDLTDGDIPIGVVEVADTANTGTASLPTQFFTSFKTSNNVNIGYESSNAYVEAMSISASAGDTTIENKVSDKDVIFKVNDGGVSSESMRIDGDINQVKIKSLGIGTAAELTITESSDDITIKNTVSDKDIIFNINDGGSDTEVMRIDGSTSRVGIGQNTPTAPLHIKTTDVGDALIVESTEAGATDAPDLVLYRNSGSPAVNDTIGSIKFRGKDNGGNDVDYVELETKLTDVTNTSEDSKFQINMLRNGAVNELFTIGKGECVINEASTTMEFRVESATNTHMFFVDAFAEGVCIGTATPDANTIFTVEGAISLDEISAPTNTADRGQIYTNADNELHMIDGAGNDTIFLKGGQHSIWIPAEAISPRGNAGCADLATTNAATNGRPDIRSLAFDKDSDEHGQFTIAMPKMWNEGTITAQFYWTNAAATSGTVAWGLQGVSLSNDDAIDTAFGTAVVTSDTQTGTAKDVHISPKSSAITIAGSPAANDLTCFQVYRDVSADNLAEDALLLGIKLLYTIDTGNDA